MCMYSMLVMENECCKEDLVLCWIRLNIWVNDAKRPFLQLHESGMVLVFKGAVKWT